MLLSLVSKLVTKHHHYACCVLCTMTCVLRPSGDDHVSRGLTIVTRGLRNSRENDLTNRCRPDEQMSLKVSQSLSKTVRLDKQIWNTGLSGVQALSGAKSTSQRNKESLFSSTLGGIDSSASCRRPEPTLTDSQVLKRNGRLL